jgi:tetratricopeptide (TPR) repeat protein
VIKLEIEELINKIENKHLVASLGLINLAVTEIWDLNKNPKLVQYYTEHGIEHSRRMLLNAIKILEINNNIILSKPNNDEGLYLLIAGIFLHDIGMQCDIRKHKQVKNIAERKYKANFENIPNPKSKDNLTQELQESIRKNHNYLTAAWIDYEYSSNKNKNKTILRSAIQSIPDHLVDDVIDICRYHSKLSIDECPEKSKNHPYACKRLIAAILRLCDEMDITSSRGDDATPSMFSLPPRNAMYWHLHGRTRISFEHNEIMMTIRVSPKDKANLEDKLYKDFINGFKVKNEPLMSVLSKYNIFINMSNKSGIECHNRAKDFDDETVAAIKAYNTVDPLDNLATEVNSWLEAIGYKIGNRSRISFDAIDMIADITHGTLIQKVLVRCTDGMITPKHIVELDNLLDKKIPQGWLISGWCASPLAIKRSEEYDSIKIFTLSQFLCDKVWKKYFDIIEFKINRDRIKDFYVNLGCYVLHPDKNYENFENRLNKNYKKDKFTDIDELVDVWLKKEGKQHLLLLGEFGSGKTWFCLYYVCRQIDRYRNDPARERLPLYIDVGSLTRPLNHRTLINNVLQEQYKLELVGAPFKIFDDLNQKGKILLIIDGFDQMSQKADDNIVVGNFLELTRLISPNSKIIITSRTEFFRDRADIDDVTVFSESRFNPIFIEPFTEDQIVEAIYKRIGKENGAQIVNKILKDTKLAELAKKPVLVELLLDVLTRENAPEIKKLSQVYLLYTEMYLLKKPEEIITIKQKLYLLCELAWDMIQRNYESINSEEIRHMIQEFIKVRTGRRIDFFEFAFRNQAMLRNDAEGNYSFSHRSLAEYFVALKFAAELGCLGPEFKKSYCDSESNSYIPYEQKNLADVVRTFGARSLLNKEMDGIRNFLVEMITLRGLWTLIADIKKAPKEDVKFCLENANILLRDMHRFDECNPETPSISDFPDLMPLDKTPEAVILIRPASDEKMLIELEKLGAYNRNDKIFRGNKIVESYNLAINGFLSKASDLAKQEFDNNKELKNFCLSILAFSALESLYKKNYIDSLNYLEEYNNCGGYRLWYELKRGLVLQFRRSEGDWDAAKSIYKNILKIPKKLAKEKKDLYKMKGRALLYWGIQDRIDDQHYKSISKYKRAINIFIRENDSYHEGMARAQLGIAYRMTEEYTEAISEYCRAIQIFADKDDYRLACVKGRIGTTYRMLRDYKRAIEYYESSIDLFDKYEDRFRQAYVQKQLGTTLIITGNWEKAIETLSKAADTFHDLGYIEKEMKTRYNLGIAYHMQGKWKETTSVFEKLLNCYKTYDIEDDEWTQSLVYSGLGNSYRMLDDYTNSHKYFTKALEIVRKREDHYREAWILQRIGRVLTLQYHYNDAIDCLKESQNLLKNLNTSNLDESKLALIKAKIEGDLGYIYRKMNDLERAIQHFDKAKAIFDEAKDEVNLCWIMEKQSGINLIRGLFDEAIGGYENILEILDSEGIYKGEDVINVIFNDSYLVYGVFKEGFLNYKNYFKDINNKIKNSIKGKALRNLGDIHRRKGDFKIAIDYLNKSLEILELDDLDQRGQSLCLLGMVHCSNLDFGLTNDCLIKANDIFKGIGEDYLRGWCLTQLGILYIFQHEWDNGIKSFSKAIELLESKDYKLETYYNYNLCIARMSRALCFRNANRNQEFKEEIAFSKQIISSLTPPIISEYELARFYAINGDDVNALTYLDIALRKKQVGIKIIKQDPYIDIIRNKYNYMQWLGNRELLNIPIHPWDL